MTDITQAFLKEVDDALHEERVRVFWLKYRVVIIAGAIALMAVSGGWQLWKAYQHQVAQGVAARWEALSHKPEDQQVAVLNDVAQTGVVGFRALAETELAKRALAANPADIATARANYTKIADDSSAPMWLRNLARFDRALVTMEIDKAGAKADLEALAAQDDSAMMPATLELLAVIAITEGDTLKARDLTTRLLAMPNLPADLRQRAAARLGAVSTLAQ